MSSSSFIALKAAPPEMRTQQREYRLWEKLFLLLQTVARKSKKVYEVHL